MSSTFVFLCFSNYKRPYGIYWRVNRRDTSVFTLRDFWIFQFSPHREDVFNEDRRQGDRGGDRLFNFGKAQVVIIDPEKAMQIQLRVL